MNSQLQSKLEYILQGRWLSLSPSYNKVQVQHDNKNRNKNNCDIKTVIFDKPTDSVILKPKDTQCYLDFFFNEKLFFDTILITILIKYYLLSRI